LSEWAIFSAKVGQEKTDMAPRIRSQAQLAALRTAQVPPSLHDHSIISKTTAAAMAGHSIRSFDRLLASGNGPPFVWLGPHRKGFVIGKVKDWIETLADNAT
jgi:hypothetical protein